MEVNFSKEELDLLKESLNYAVLSFDSKSSEYLANQENYAKIYREKKLALQALIEKINVYNPL